MGRITGNPTPVGAALAVLAGGCVVSPAPQYEVEVAAGLVRAPALDVAADAAGLLEAGRALLEQRVPDLEDTPVEVWVQEPGRVRAPGPDYFAHRAYTLRRPGRRPRIHVSTLGYRDSLQHELAHALLGESWRALPLAAEEGLCSLLNQELADPALTVAHLRCAAQAGSGTRYSVSIRVRGPGGEPAEYSTLWGHGGGSDATGSTLAVAEILALSGSADMDTLTGAEIGHVYGVGLLVVRRIAELRGIEGLHELCLRARSEGLERIPGPWLLEAARIESDEQLVGLAREELHAESLRAALRSESFEGVLRRAVREAAMGPSDGAEELLARFEGTLRIDGAPLDLGSLPAFRAWLRDNWAALRAPGASDSPGSMESVH